jgi:redox-sensitive bicupin YhaK (pirin superfamily)
MFHIIPNRLLGLSEPNPKWFGNPPNDSSSPYWTNPNWLKSRFHFSFAEYNNPHNMGYGVVRVLNDDLVQPNRGFGEHPHANVEICTYIVQGELTHQDSMGTEETLSKGAIQFMTAGRGVRHQEHNLHPTNPLRFLQIWINTRKQDLKPNYGSGCLPPESRCNKWSHLVSDIINTSVITPIKINQDANIFVTEVQPGSTVNVSIAAGRQAYLVCVEGTAHISSSSSSDDNDSTTHTIERHDAMEIYQHAALTFSAPADADADGEPLHMLMIEMAFTGKGRTDL